MSFFACKNLTETAAQSLGSRDLHGMHTEAMDVHPMHGIHDVSISLTY